MKHLNLLILVLVLGAGLIACGDETAQRATTTDETWTSSAGDEEPEEEAVDEAEPEDPEPEG